MKSGKIFVLIPDGVGLRNFAFTSFAEIGQTMDWEVIFWNHTPFGLEELGLREIKQFGKARAKTDLLKRAKIEAELDFFTDRFQDSVYQTYKFPPSRSTGKNLLKNVLVNSLRRFYNGEKGIAALRKKMQNSERKGKFYRSCKELLKDQKPDFLFCTNQRPVNAIAPMTAAQDLQIPTASFIFSWDNLPKATIVLEPDYYFVWSEYMKDELLTYYPSIKQEAVHVAGSPQFEPHFNQSLVRSREEFFKEYELDLNRKYICFSGDDQTTSPFDPAFLEDLASAVRALNKKDFKVGILFRHSPVDFSGRYDKVLQENLDIITSIAPKWKKMGDDWNTILPTKEDLQLQVNLILHSEAVANVGSSMVFDFAIHGKPCLFFNYNPKNTTGSDWTVEKIYSFVHFRSMPTKGEVFWINSREEIPGKVKSAICDPREKSELAMKWFEKIAMAPAEKANERIWEGIHRVLKNT